jgi:CRP/FNR family transcriptional regulator, dissimilatory nitrate respiration regulator
MEGYMQALLPILSKTRLFQGLQDAQIIAMLGCLNAEQHSYAKGEYVLLEGVRVDAFGLVLAGSVHIVQEDFWGNRNIIAGIGVGEVFAESYACLAHAPLAVSAVAQEATNVLFLNVKKILTTCAAACEYHSGVIHNLVTMLAAKNLRMNEKLQHVMQRTTREKLLSFLSAESRRAGSAAFEIPFNRQQLADYLSVDRSAMSSELCKLRDESALRFVRNRFELLRTDGGCP